MTFWNRSVWERRPGSGKTDVVVAATRDIFGAVDAEGVGLVGVTHGDGDCFFGDCF